MQGKRLAATSNLMTSSRPERGAWQRVAVRLSLLLAVGCGGTTASQPGPASPVTTTPPVPTTTVRVFCDGGSQGVFASSTAQRPFGGPTRIQQTPLRVEVPPVTHATRARASFDTVAGEIHGYVDTSALGLVVQETTLMIGAPVHLGAGGAVCVPLHGETPDSFPAEATVHLPEGWTFDLMAPIRVEGTHYTWRGRVPRGAVAPTPNRGGDRSYSGRFNNTTIELLTDDGRVLARGPAPRTGTMVRGRSGDLLEVALTATFGIHGLRGFIRSPAELDPPPRDESASPSGSFMASGLGIGGLGRGSSLPEEARPLGDVGTDRPLHALIPGSVFTLPTGQELSLPDPTYARVTVGTRWVAVVFADGTLLAGTVDPTAIGELIREAVAR